MSKGPTGEEEQDWRLQAELNLSEPRGPLTKLVARFRGPNVIEQVQAAMPRDVVLTHDGRLLFAYAADESTLTTARGAIEGALREDGLEAFLRISHWDTALDAWHQIEPPATTSEKLAEDAAERDAETVETRTLVATAGKEVRVEFDQTMQGWADRLGLECKIVEHPHLLRTQVCFTVTGPRRKIEEFSQGLTAEGRAMMRTEGAVMASPL